MISKFLEGWRAMFNVPALHADLARKNAVIERLENDLREARIYRGPSLQEVGQRFDAALIFKAVKEDAVRRLAPVLRDQIFRELAGAMERVKPLRDSYEAEGYVAAEINAPVVHTRIKIPEFVVEFSVWLTPEW